MKLLLVIGHRYYKADGQLWADTSHCYDPFLAEYLTVFNAVDVISRIIKTEKTEPAWQLVSGPAVKLIGTADYSGAWEFLKVLFPTFFICRRAVAESEAIILRIPSDVGTMCWFWAKVYRKKYATTLVSVGAETIRQLPLNHRTLLLKLFGRINDLLLGMQIKGAVACSYVSRKLVELFPPRGGIGSWFFSTVQIDEQDIGQARQSLPTDKPLRIVTTTGLFGFKGNKYILQALKLLDEKGFRNWSFTLIGKGPEKDALRKQVETLGLADRVQMPGFIISQNKLFEHLDNADLFVFSSLTEGMPRAIIEACARGLPVISTDVGGVSDLIDSKWLVKIKDADAIANKILEIIRDEQDYVTASKNNLERSRDYLQKALLKQKIEFMRVYKAILEEKP